MESSDITAEIRMAVLGEWVPPQLADVLALQRAEEPETHAVLGGWTDPGRGAELPDDGFDFALSAVSRQWPGWVCEPLWHDTLAVAVAKRSHLLAYREVPCGEVLKQPLICSQSTADEPWRMTVQRVFENALQEREQTVETFDVAMTLVAAGYGIAIAPAARLASYLGEPAEFGKNRTLRFSGHSQRSELPVLQPAALPPDVIAGQVNVLPAQRRQVLQQFAVHRLARVAHRMGGAL
ncbi:transcriptional regulator [Pseudomonas aeruginosa]|nr:transcriptional regulator [Pseudomonas aeruginosa]